MQFKKHVDKYRSIKKDENLRQCGSQEATVGGCMHRGNIH